MTSCDILPLFTMEAYRHQVGGHSQLMKPQHSSKVYKPFTESEFRFYEKLAGLGSTATDSGPLHTLKQFVPKYFGVTEVQTPSLPRSHFPSSGDYLSSNRIKHPSRSKKTVTEDGSSSPMIESSTGQQRKCSDNKTTCDNKHLDDIPIDTRQPSSPSFSSSLLSNPSTILKYLVLEDLVYQYKKPCVMDLKMGKRQRKIGASSEKKQRQLEKSLKTTSHAVGFRLCGMQFYDKKNDILCYRDKYWGRKLTKDVLRDSIDNWFWDGYVSYHELILPLISSLKILHSCISKLRHYRFWSSSLLWVFDGGLSDSNARLKTLDVRMIDFANTIVLKDNPSPDEEYLFGLGNLISILDSLVSTSLSDICASKLPSRPSSAQLASERGDDSSDSQTIADDEKSYRDETSHMPAITVTIELA